MPATARCLDARTVDAVCAEPFAEPDRDRIGIEIEWHLHDADAPSARPGDALIAALDGRVLPAGGRITFEPGGQVELSTGPADTVASVLAAADRDAAELDRELGATGWTRSSEPVDGRRAPERVLLRDRYAAMEAFFAARGRAGAWMMTNTASTQVNLSHCGRDPARRWRLFHRIGPALAAAFANSPGRGLDGRPWASLRTGIWAAIDPSRTRAVDHRGDPATAWRDYALAADVMIIGGPRNGVGLAPGLSFGRWLRDGHELGWPTHDDLRYHLTTLFPPVRPKGWLELRFLDALPDEWCTVAVLVAATLAADGLAAETDRLPDVAGRWAASGRRGLGDPELAAAADRMFELVSANLSGITRDPGHAALLETFRERFVDRRRSPGSEVSPLDLYSLSSVPGVWNRESSTLRVRSSCFRSERDSPSSNAFS